jgi:hypothetical protein
MSPYAVQSCASFNPISSVERVCIKDSYLTAAALQKSNPAIPVLLNARSLSLKLGQINHYSGLSGHPRLQRLVEYNHVWPSSEAWTLPPGQDDRLSLASNAAPVVRNRSIPLSASASRKNKEMPAGDNNNPGQNLLFDRLP